MAQGLRYPASIVGRPPVDPFRPRRAVFLDRDGTIIDDVGYLRNPAQVRLLTGAAEGLRTLAAAGYLLVVISNQSGLARGLATPADLAAGHERMAELLAREGVALAASYYCPYLAEGSVREYVRTSDLRKPGPGMLLRAAWELGLFLPLCWTVGDAARDVEAGAAAGTRTIRIGGTPEKGRFFADSLRAAATIIVSAK